MSVGASYYSLQGPQLATGIVGTAFTLTLIPNGTTAVGTVTLSVSGVTGTFGSATLTFSGPTYLTTTFTPTSAGTATFSATNTAGLVNPPNFVVTVVAASTTATPTFSPGSQYAAFPYNVTISCATSGASIYYTTNGTTPTSGSTQYTGPIAISAVTNLQAVAIFSGTSSAVASAWYHDARIYPSLTWYDVNGVPIYATDGITYNFNGTWYWYGTDRNAPTVSGNQTGRFVGIYSSPDLLNWTFLGDVCPAIAGSDIVERPHVLYNSANNNYVMWFHRDSTSYGYMQVQVATATSPGGPWYLVTEPFQPDGNSSADLALFQDTNGTAYIVYAAQGGTQVYVTQLNSSYTGVVAGSSVNTGLGSLEAPAMFKRGNTYFLLMSHLNNFSPALNIYATAPSPLGPWTNMGNPFQPVLGGSPSNLLAFGSQTSVVVNYQGNYIYGGTVTPPTNLMSSTQLWLPIQFPTPSTLSINWLSLWSPNQVFSQGAVGYPSRNLVGSRNSATGRYLVSG